MSGQLKRFSLQFVNAAEDYPRLILCYAKWCDGECALVIRPLDDRVLLVHVKKNGEEFAWTEDHGNAPGTPLLVLKRGQAVAMVKDYKKEPGRPGAIQLRGQWSGKLVCDGGEPRIELVRKVASYANLLVVSEPGKGWKYQLNRTEKWFSRPTQHQAIFSTLREAIEKGYAAMLGVLGEACSVRDSHRRAALDPVYAETHPLVPAKEREDRTAKFQPKEPKTPKAPRSPRAARAVAEDVAAPPVERKARSSRTSGDGGTNSATEKRATRASANNDQPTVKTTRAASGKVATDQERKPRDRKVSAEAGGDEEVNPAMDLLIENAFVSAIERKLGAMASN